MLPFCDPVPVFCTSVRSRFRTNPRLSFLPTESTEYIHKTHTGGKSAPMSLGWWVRARCYESVRTALMSYSPTCSMARHKAFVHGNYNGRLVSTRCTEMSYEVRFGRNRRLWLRRQFLQDFKSTRAHICSHSMTEKLE